MSSRTVEKQRAREARVAAEQAAERGALRRRRLITLGAVAAAAVLIVVVSIVASQAGREDPAPAAEAQALFAGIPQDGADLGRPDAPVVVEEYADLQCPFCAQAAASTVPPIIREYVRTGQVRLRFRTLACLGEDSIEAGRATVAAGQQDRLWPFVERFYAAQGQENSGYVTEEFLREVAGGVPGLSADRMLDAAGSAAAERQLAEDAAAAQRAGVSSTPTFLVGRRGRPLEPVPDATADGLRTAIEEQIPGGR